MSGGRATGANVSHAELQAQFFPLGEWPDKDTRARIRFIIDEGLQADPELIRQSLPQSLRDDTYEYPHTPPPPPHPTPSTHTILFWGHWPA